MFAYIKHGDNQQFLINTNCRLYILLHYIRRKLGLAKTDTIDLCDESGSMKMLFQIKRSEQYATKFVPARKTYYVCRVRRGAPGTGLQNAYLAFEPFLETPTPRLIAALQAQCNMLERSRLKLCRMERPGQKITWMASSITPSSTPREAVKGRLYKSQTKLIRKKSKLRVNKNKRR